VITPARPGSARRGGAVPVLAWVVVGVVAAGVVVAGAVAMTARVIGTHGSRPQGTSADVSPHASNGPAAPGSMPSPVALQGFARGTTGGLGGRVVTVTSLADSGPGTLRAALSQPGPAWVRFTVSGTLVLASPVSVPSDTTIDGRGADVTIEHKGLLIDAVHNVIVENLKFTAIRGSNSDAISVRNGASRVWIDHSSFSDGQDGLVDITYGATDVTVSWCHFFHHDKVMLISVLKGTGVMQVTLHHNWFDHTVQRNPLVRDAYVHAFDNYVDGWTAYGMQAQKGGYLFAQDNVFQAAPGSDSTDAIRVSDGKWGEGVVLATGDVLLNGAEQTDRLGSELPTVHYAYALQAAGAELAREISSGAGWQPYRISPQPMPLPLT
jgi:pectate lyase